MLKKLLATALVASFICGFAERSFAQSSEAKAPLGWDFGIGLTSGPHGSGVNLNLA